ncbi:MAG: YvcK family protein [Clostridiales bacterium]|nr:YvcK family protein [Clostridiales bacterium]
MTIDNNQDKLNPNIVVIGGGTGLSTLLRGLKGIYENITAIVAVSDDGGSSGIIRQNLHMLPPGDIRNCILALANTEPTMYELLNYRFAEGPLKGHCFGNLFLAALNGISGSFDLAVQRMNEVLAVTGCVVPVTTSNVHLEALFADGSTVLGESSIFFHKKQHDCRIRRIRLVPEKPPALPKAISAIENADIIVLGPGSLYTSIIPNLLVDGINDAIRRTDALKIFVLNIMTQDGETENYSAYDHVKEIFAHSFSRVFNICLYNTEEISFECLDQYKTEDAQPVIIDSEFFVHSGVELIGKKLISNAGGYVRHDPHKLANAIDEIYKTKARRG